MIESGTKTTPECEPCVADDGGVDEAEAETNLTCQDLEGVFGPDVSLLF